MKSTSEILSQKNMELSDLTTLLLLEDKNDIDMLYKRAYQVKTENVGTKVFFRGIIELSNICAKDCYYCGIRKSNESIERFIMEEEEILNAAKWAYEAGYGSIVLQSGERCDSKFTEFIETLLIKIKNQTENKLGITLSLGEQTEGTLKRWFNAGGHRYLLRIETSNPSLYQSLHPDTHSFNERITCLKTLKSLGYQTGTGVMIGLPNQTIEDLANDLAFFKQNDIDMIGMGPFIPHHDTPLAHSMGNFDDYKNKQLELALKMIAVARIYLKDVNIASTTALQALDHSGREMGLQAGANIIMPNVTDTKYRDKYQLYDNKPCMDENSTMCKACLGNRVKSVGETIGYNEWGDSPHFKKRLK
ncbi:MAG: [FeFe] hydrogenase H-cluster radical SAM maturase HydE [Gammaproteobacteria bacterium]|nr:MAG: [FeFe] hydrogenase H-cluster radical SAM maturase HydE [Gammaproteobacteria bacterium]